jgi:hypothetical protein
MNKSLKILLLVAGFLLIFSNMSNRFDPDLGWHLRFGKEAWNGYFSYNDSYTWGDNGWPWINHEWGGDLLSWIIYSKPGYLSLLAFTSLVAWFGFILSSQRLNKTISVEALLAALLTAWTVKEIAMMRLATLTIMLLALLLYSLSRIHEKRLYLWWPLLIWVWSIIHGSWFIGIIIAATYWSAMVFDYLTAKYFRAHPINLMTPRKLIESFSAIVISLLTVIANPYGLKLIYEVTSYFQIDYYKTRIAEWTGSYAYPIFLVPLLVGPALVIINLILRRKKRIPTGELVVTIMLTAAAIKYRRQWLSASIMVTPSLRIILEQIFYGFSSFISEARLKKMLGITGVLSLLLMCGAYLSKTNYASDIWSNDQLLKENRLPLEATKFLKQQLPNTTTTDIFNEFSWGGYLNWNLPEARVYIDGRGSGTWLVGTSTPFLKSYYDIMFGSDGLKFLENKQIKYILIRPEYREANANLSWPNNEFYKPASSTQSQIRQDLVSNKYWQKIYGDDIAEVWRYEK